MQFLAHCEFTSVTSVTYKVIILNTLMAHKGHSPWPRACVSTSTDGRCSALTKVMQINWFSGILSYRAILLLVVLGFCRPVLAQQVSLALLHSEAMEPAPMVHSTQPAPLPEAPSHRFWDRENNILFVTDAAFSAADFVVTRDNLRGGGQELNPVTRVFSGSTAALAVNFAGETAGVVGLSYFFHKTGHHKMERYISMLNIGSSATAVTFDLAHR